LRGPDDRQYLIRDDPLALELNLLKVRAEQGLPMHLRGFPLLQAGGGERRGSVAATVGLYQPN